jgi:hypothetical protein
MQLLNHGCLNETKTNVKLHIIYMYINVLKGGSISNTELNLVIRISATIFSDPTPMTDLTRASTILKGSRPPHIWDVSWAV